jgi:hypothetical protein
LMPDNVNSLSLGQRTSGSKKPLCLSSKGGLKIKHLLISLQIFASFFSLALLAKADANLNAFFFPSKFLPHFFSNRAACCCPVPLICDCKGRTPQYSVQELERKNFLSKKQVTEIQ